MNATDLFTRNARFYPDNTAVVFREQRFTYGEINERVNRLAHHLIELGVQKGDRVGMMFYNSVQFYEIFYSLLKIGAVAVPMNFRMISREVQWILDNARCKALVYSGAFAELVDPVKKDLATVELFVCAGQAAPSGEVHLESLYEAGSTAEPQTRVDIQDPAQIQYTGGTTGLPKGAVISHRSMIFTCLGSLLAMHLSEPSEVFLNQLPMFHVAGLNMMLFCSAIGGTFVIVETFDPQKILELMQKEKATFLLLIPPSTYVRLMNYPSIQDFDTSSIRTLLSAAGALIRPLVLKLLDTFPNAHIYSGWALSEATGGTVHRITREMAEKEPEKLNSVGKPLVMMEVRLVDDDGREVPTGEVGEAIVRGPGVMSEYFDQPDLTAQTLKEGWLYTGDLMKRDRSGCFFFEDRKKDMIKSGGENVFTQEVERIILSHPSVENCAVLGVPDPVLQEAVAAFVKLAEGKTATQEEIIQHCKDFLSSYKKPRHVVFVDELPIGPGQKTQKFKLREKFKD